MSEEDPASRLRQARERAGYRNATDAARRIGVKVVTYTAHENGGREYDRKTALHYARAYGVEPGWLMFGGDIGEQGKAVRSAGHAVREIDLKEVARIPAGSLLTSKATPVSSVWNVPTDVLVNRMRVSPESAWIFEVTGDAMFDPLNPGVPGSLLPGDRVVVDASDRHPTPPGTFAIFDSGAIMLRLIEAIYHSDPPRFSLTSRNPQYRSYEVTASEVTILGRVKGRVTAL